MAMQIILLTSERWSLQSPWKSKEKGKCLFSSWSHCVAHPAGHTPGSSLHPLWAAGPALLGLLFEMIDKQLSVIGSVTMLGCVHAWSAKFPFSKSEDWKCSVPLRKCNLNSCIVNSQTARSFTAEMIPPPHPWRVAKSDHHECELSAQCGATSSSSFVLL